MATPNPVISIGVGGNGVGSRRNLVRNPIAASDLTAISASTPNLNAGATVTRVATGGPHAAYANSYISAVTTAASSSQGVSLLVNNQVYASGVTYRARAYVYTTDTDWQLRLGGTHTDVGGGVAITPTAAWQVVTCTWTPSANRTASNDYAFTARTTTAAIRTIFVSEVIVEAGITPTAYFSGAGYVDGAGRFVSAGTGWTGTANASASDKTPHAVGIATPGGDVVCNAIP